MAASPISMKNSHFNRTPQSKQKHFDIMQYLCIVLPHFRTGVNVKSHVVEVDAFRPVFVDLTNVGYLEEGGQGAQTEKGVVRIVVQVNRRNAVRKNVQNSHADDLPIQNVLLEKTFVASLSCMLKQSRTCYGCQTVKKSLICLKGNQ